MRRLNRKKTLNLMKELDAFPKVPESYVETSVSGGTVSLIAFTTIAFLTVMEFTVYRDTWMKYEYEVDKDFTSKLRINIDITVAMRCQYVGADVLDLAETMVASADGLIYEPVVFDLSPQQKEWQRMLQLIQSRLQEEHSLQDVIFKSAFKSASTALPPREDNSLQSPDACRIHGHLYVNKVAGNFHITVGKAIPHPRGHAHLAALVSHESYNFSHRIDHLSFGELIPGIINPLDGTEKIASDHNQMFQYFITIVPTKLHTYKISAETHQFSVTEREFYMALEDLWQKLFFAVSDWALTDPHRSHFLMATQATTYLELRTIVRISLLRKRSFFLPDTEDIFYNKENIVQYAETVLMGSKKRSLYKKNQPTNSKTTCVIFCLSKCTWSHGRV
uniref:Endoplasmic reticulum-Golgi intermediate compartment protein n=1 Tax=Calidris pygmaea TaxID=425635 RepID=A0A8C3J8P5_9CHAR